MHFSSHLHTWTFLVSQTSLDPDHDENNQSYLSNNSFHQFTGNTRKHETCSKPLVLSTRRGPHTPLPGAFPLWPFCGPWNPRHPNFTLLSGSPVGHSQTVIPGISKYLICPQNVLPHELSLWRALTVSLPIPRTRP